MTEKDYSGTPLPTKLGIKDGSSVAIVNEPDGFLEWFQPLLPETVALHDRAAGPLDVIVFFSSGQTHLRRRFSVLAGFLEPAGGLWVAYPKKASARETDLTFETVQQVGLDAGLVDNKSCAIDDDWSGVRFVYRLKDRA
ncbi:MAG: DUF3052 domain-containing protein [Actinomycetota bacterium]|nr:DUF3052 domain-containing protein [Actinomycetota bacterium]